MEISNDLSVGQRRKKRRPPLACIPCRDRKVKCDHNKPCTQCVRTNRPSSCIYIQDARVPEAGLDNSLLVHHGNIPMPSASSSSDIRNKSGVTHGFPSPEADNIHSNVPLAPDSAHVLSVQPNKTEAQLSATLHALQKRVQQLENKSDALSHTERLRKQPAGSRQATGWTNLPIRGNFTENKTRFFVESHWRSCTPQVRRCFRLAATLRFPDFCSVRNALEDQTKVLGHRALGACDSGKQMQEYGESD
jgi:hypothetical protein